MPHQPLEPTVRRRRLGQTLKKLRTGAGMTLEDAAAAMQWKVPKLSKIENARQQIRPAEVTALLRAYRVTDPEVFTALENLARDAGKKGWWQTYSGVVSPAYADYISLEDDAERICEWAPLAIPGLLQTAAYARETMTATGESRTAQEITALAEVRQSRQAVLTRPGHPLQLWAIIHEAALHTRFEVRPATMREQLRRLLDASELPNVTVQIMPLDSTAHPGLFGGFGLVSFPGPTPDVVLLENLNGATYVEGDGAQPFASAVERIRAAALSVEDALARIAQLEEGHRK
ncbi:MULTISPECIES: helix-turn-helix domain-containing protein [Streptomyces]|uniref:helix-turn-helix domain-containing protein n=1 Tax=Streptomyces TaxID=1883 RepID=UPI00287FCC37|nr:helix-turn-helix transcriptional regulator [Streptomyces sp. CGMCC 4.1456]WNF67164.1 helix-turn-helix transcriptional regulator [Streptomyces sp. CGMCC 4.1456]